MEPRIEVLHQKKLLGFHVTMSIVKNKTAQLWGEFGPRIKEIEKRVSADKISLQVYPLSYFEQFDASTKFEKWATVEVTNFDLIPNEMETLTLEGGLYAVFDFKGSSSDISVFSFFQYIYGEWLPKSDYKIDDRPHFEILGEKYANNDPNSEEEIWIPLKEK